MQGDQEKIVLRSLPMRGEWIEIAKGERLSLYGGTSLPMRGEWIEIMQELGEALQNESLPMRGEWIEILYSTM